MRHVLSISGEELRSGVHNSIGAHDVHTYQYAERRRIHTYASRSKQQALSIQHVAHKPYILINTASNNMYYGELIYY